MEGLSNSIPGEGSYPRGGCPRDPFLAREGPMLRAGDVPGAKLRHLFPAEG